MEEHRLVKPVSLRVFDCSRGCSNFDFIERNLAPTYPIQRFFSIMRSMGALTLVVENISFDGLLQEEYDDLRSFNYWSSEGALRLSFWDVPFSHATEIDRLSDDNALGYLIAKESGADAVSSDWVVFEAVSNALRVGQGVYPSLGKYSFGVGDRVFHVKGCLYCQQNGLTSRCSHVALRSLLSAILDEHDFSVRRMNAIAGLVKSEEIQLGLDVTEIRKVVEAAGLSYYDVYYGSVKTGKKLTYKPGQLPFHSFLYSGIESGCGSLLWFGVSATDKPGSHLIPFFGHTFDRDMWAADAQSRYLRSKHKIPTFLSSEIWSDRFIGHDDNFGANITMPQYFISPNMLSYVMSIYRGGLKDSSGVFAEAEAVAWLYNSLLKSMPDENPWVRRLKCAANAGAPRIVMRSLLIDKSQYLAHLRQLEDLTGRKAREEEIAQIEGAVPERAWMVELSIHQLFPINRRKVGEILFDATLLKANDAKAVRRVGIPFSLARLPDFYLSKESGVQVPDYDAISSSLTSHVECFRFPDAIDMEAAKYERSGL